jgi:hypothetical protein
MWAQHHGAKCMLVYNLVGCRCSSCALSDCRSSFATVNQARCKHLPMTMNAVPYNTSRENRFSLPPPLVRFPIIQLGMLPTRSHVASLILDESVTVGRLLLRLQLPLMCQTTGRMPVYGYWVFDYHGSVSDRVKS